MREGNREQAGKRGWLLRALKREREGKRGRERKLEFGTDLRSTLKYNSMAGEVQVEEIVVEKEDVDARDELDAGMVEFVVPKVDEELKPKLRIKFDSLDEGYIAFTTIMHL
ncbi:S2-RNase [Pyrus ussuriensis x Pyrus communis]|uniref:S2-RNase n=1 Tax=Pyrus ussuriensis x Pyrus communis TaxID=2448454 RepID=A0A5N5GC51_9ROSA|nr:S2-RNase [Pyrus ussuriensis x Pyrus communis]